MAVSSEFFAARVNDSVVRLDDSVDPQEFKVCYCRIQGDNPGQLQPPVDLVPAVLAASWPLM